jgi:hypothetical protein
MISNLFYAHKNLRSLEEHLNQQLINIHNWLCANKLSLNVDKSHFVIFHPVQKVVDYTINLSINNKDLVGKKSYKYLGVIITSTGKSMLMNFVKRFPVVLAYYQSSQFC